jgi:hypothetical protein
VRLCENYSPSEIVERLSLPQPVAWALERLFQYLNDSAGAMLGQGRIGQCVRLEEVAFECGRQGDGHLTKRRKGGLASGENVGEGTGVLRPQKVLVSETF